MITRDEVIQCYRFLLGRDPENDEVINHYANSVSSWRKLRELFMASPEFRVKMEEIGTPRIARMPISGPPMSVEVSASNNQLAGLLAKTQQQWQHLGETEPHWSVLTQESYRQENFDSNREAFYASGEAEVKGFESALARAGIKLDTLHTCLELGCGTGRVTAALARRFEAVTAVDISTAHLAKANSYFHEKQLGNIALHQLRAVEDLAATGRFDVLYTRLVLQHNSPPVMVRLLRDLLNNLNQGGVAFFQLPTYQAGYSFQIDRYLQQTNDTQMELHFLPQSTLLGLLADVGCKVLEIREDDSIGLSATAISNTLLVRKL